MLPVAPIVQQAAAALSERPALADDATSSALADVQEELELSSNETILEVQEMGESSSTGPDSSGSDADNHGINARSARRANLRTKPTKHHARSYSDADFSLPTSFIGGWNLNSVFLVPQKALHGTIETLFVLIVNKSLFSATWWQSTLPT